MQTATNCTNLHWTTHEDRETINPPEGTAAIVVDVRDKRAAIRIFTSNEEYLTGVGSEEAGNLVVGPWQSNWFYLCTGSPRVGHIAGG
jgi:hypothetical protein